ncbi:MAG: prepilin-type N-terminal cleavage/methylation domain-containing protein [Sulfurifustis sp.]
MTRRAATAQRGATLVELVISIVVIAVGLAGVLTVIDHVTRSSGDPMVEQQAIAVAESYLEEILLKAYDETAATGNPEGAPGPDAGETNRTLYNDVNDFDALANNGCIATTPACPALGSCACDQNGNPISSLRGYSVAVQVDTTATLNAVPASRVQVTVTAPGGVAVTLGGYRTNY